MWVEGVLSAAGLLRDLSSSFTCPIHCGSSIALPLLLGLSLGCLLGFAFGLFLAIKIRQFLAQEQEPRFASPLHSSPKARYRGSRLSGYLHE